MTLRQLTATQRPYEGDDRVGHGERRVLSGALERACVGGDLPADALTEPTRVVDEAATERARQWAFERGAGWNVQYKAGPDKTTYHVTPAAFAAWLHAQGQEPSKHVRKWFSVKGVAWPPVAALAVVADTFPLADWPALVAYRKANKGKDWGLGNQIGIARGERARRMADGNITESAALQAMANELGMKDREALRRPISENTTRARVAQRVKKSAQAPATMVRDGKRAA
jgi:hypothetical protein